MLTIVPTAAAAFIFALPAVLATPVTFTDGSFTGWNAHSFNGSTTQNVSTSISGGNPGAFLNVRTVSNATEITAISGPFTYNAGASGAITGIDFSLDIKELFTFGQGMGFALLAEQNGTSYYAAFQGTGGQYPNWSTVTTTGITLGDFNAGGLDFSTSGAAITFGLLTSNQGGAGINVGYDNVTITVNPSRTNSVPDGGSTFVAVAIGMLGLGVVRRLRM